MLITKIILNVLKKLIGQFILSITFKFLDNISTSDFLNHTYKLVHFAKEVIQIAKLKKSLIARFFDMIFG